jgi:CheY-like chemotaxis protein
MHLLLVEDTPGDVRLTQEAFREANSAVQLHVVTDGGEAMAFLRHKAEHGDAPRPDLILLDLNLPKLHGHELLTLIKKDPSPKSIPTVVLTTSEAEAGIVTSYPLHANCYLAKPVQFGDFQNVVTKINDLWLEKAPLRPGTASK